MAAFVADGFLRFDGIVPRAPSAAVLAELAGGGPPSPFGAAPGSDAAAWPGQPLAALFGASPAVAAMLRLPAVAGVIESLLGPDPIYDHHYTHVIAPRSAGASPGTPTPSWTRDAARSTSSCSSSPTTRPVRWAAR